jgi:hypothetical protein
LTWPIRDESSAQPGKITRRTEVPDQVCRVASDGNRRGVFEEWAGNPKAHGKAPRRCDRRRQSRHVDASEKWVSDIPAVQSPDHLVVDLAPSRGLQLPLAAKPLPRAGADVLPLSHEIPTTNLDLNGRRLDLKAERLVAGNKTER